MRQHIGGLKRLICQINLYHEQGSVIDRLAGFHVYPTSSRARQGQDSAMSVRVYLVVIYTGLLVVHHVAFSHVKRCVRW